MSTNYYLKSLNIRNYRSLKSVSIKNLRRINIIGGYNGTGKSSLIDVLFLMFDHRNPAAIIRQYVTRNLPLTGERELVQLFSGMDKNLKITVDSVTRNGKSKISLAYTPAPTGAQVEIRSSDIENLGNTQISKSSRMGVDIKFGFGDDVDDESFVTADSGNLNFRQIKASATPLPTCSVITAAARSTPQDDSLKYSAIVHERKSEELLEAMKVINPKVRGLQLLQGGLITTLYAELDSGEFLPTAMLGGGFQTLLSIVMSMMTSAGGVVLLDEFDSAIHHSIMEPIWKQISELANKYNCQIFAVTHSKECILAAQRGLASARGVEDLLYIRLERNNGEVAPVLYNGVELGDSLDSNWEVR